MNEIESKLKDIIAYEHVFAFKLGEQVLEKPEMKTWMLFIPFVAVVHMYRRQKYLAARNKFVAGFLTTRQWALSEAGRVVADGKKKDVKTISSQAEMPETARESHIEIIDILVDNYVNLLEAPGENMDMLIRNAYGSRADYLQYMERLSRAESRFNAALEPHLNEKYNQATETIKKIEVVSGRMRKEEARRVFP